jgi:TPR repeat protein
MGKDLSKAARNTSNKAQKTSNDRFDKADILLAKKEVSVAANNTKSTVKKKQVKTVQYTVVRCEFKLLQSEENLINDIKLRAATLDITLNKSEILRTGILALERQTDKQLKATSARIEKIKESDNPCASLALKCVEQDSASQEVQIDKSNKEHISNINTAHEKHAVSQASHITELNGYIDFYKQQIDKQAVSQESHIRELKGNIDSYKQHIDKQQQTIDKLTHCYDKAMTNLLEEKRADLNIKEVSFDAEFKIDTNHESLEEVIEEVIEEELTTSPQATIVTTSEIENNQQSADIEITYSQLPHEQITSEHEHLFDQAVIMRQEGESEQAFLLFEQAAHLGNTKAMGAMGRSFFLGEGIEEDQLQGLAWLINAAEQNLAPAMARVKYYQENDPDLYQEALTLSVELYQPTV